MRYLLFLFLLLSILSIYACQRPQNHYIQAQNTRPWMAFVVDKAYQIKLLEAERRFPKITAQNIKEKSQRPSSGKVKLIEPQLRV